MELDENHGFTYKSFTSSSEVTHISETNFLSSAVVSNEDVIQPPCSMESGPISISSSLPVPKASNNASQANAAKDGIWNIQEEETSYGLLSSTEFRDFFDSIPHISLCDRSTTSEMPDASGLTQRRITKPLQGLHQRQRSRGQNIMDNNIIRSSSWFTESHQVDLQPIPTPPPAQEL